VVVVGARVVVVVDDVDTAAAARPDPGELASPRPSKTTPAVAPSGHGAPAMIQRVMPTPMARQISASHHLPGRIGWELRLVVQGGLAILDRCDRLGARLLRERPTVGAADLPRLAWRAFAMGRAGGGAARQEEGSA